MKLYEILDSLQFEIENAANVPLTNKVMIDKDEILDLIDDLRAAIPADVEEARQIKESENRIKTKAAQEARSILDQANEHKAMLIDTNVITNAVSFNSNHMAVSIHKPVNDLTPEIFAEIKHIKRHIQLICHRSRVLHIIQRTAGFLPVDADILIFIQL